MLSLSAHKFFSVMYRDIIEKLPPTSPEWFYVGNTNIFNHMVLCMIYVDPPPRTDRGKESRGVLARKIIL